MDAPEPTRPDEEAVDVHAYRDLLARHGRWIAAAALLGALAGGQRVAFRGPVYKATAQLIIEREDPAVLSFRRVGEVNERGFAEEYYQTQLRLLRSRVVAQRTVEALQLQDDPDFGGPGGEGDAARRTAAAVSAVQRSLAVDWTRLTRLVTVSFEDASAERAARIANAAAQSFIQETVRARHQMSAEAAAWLAQQIESQRRKVAAAEVALQSTREREGIADAVLAADERRSLAEQRVRDLNIGYTTAKSRRLEREAAYLSMKNAADPQQLAEVVRNPLIQSLLQEQTTLERRLAQLDVKFLGSHPEVLLTRNQLEQTRTSLATETERLLRVAENEYQTALAHERTMQAAMAQVKDDLQALAQRAGGYDTARRDLEAAKTVLGNLMVRHKEMDISQELQFSNVRVMEPAAPPPAPLRSSLRLNLLLGGMVGALLGVGVAFGRERLDQTLRTPDEVRHLPARLLGVVPEREVGRASVVGAEEEGLFREAFRLICAGLETTPSAAGARTLLVTSTVSGEGKTVTAVNLALALAARHPRVLLVDADLRQPSVHTLLSVRPAPGLVELLADRVETVAAVQRLERSGLHLIAAGNTAGGSPDLLEPAALGRLLASLRGSYDWIVLDSPPVGQVADALALARLADATALVVRAEKTPRNAAARTLERLAEAGGAPASVVLNRARVERYPHHYSFHYGHGYGRPAGRRLRWKRADAPGSNAAA
jgi:polysaccharide biosynthesis transport protein